MIDRLANPEALALLALVPVAAWWMRGRRRHAAITLPAPPGKPLPKSVRSRLGWLPGGLRVAGLMLLIAAMSRPQHVSGKTRSRTEGVAIQLVVDRSGSMDEGIESGGRAARKMDVVRQVLEGFILGASGGEEAAVGKGTVQGREGDMLGLIAFARYADTLCPLVQDREAVAALVRTLDTVKVRSEDGTAIGDALALASARLRRAEEDVAARQRAIGVGQMPGGEGQFPGPTVEAAGYTIKSKVIVLVTDGVNNAGSEDPLEVARLAAEWGIKVYVIGVGAGERYVTMQTFAGERRVPVGPSLDEGALRAISEVTGGEYYPASDGDSLAAIVEEIGRLERSEIRVLEFDDVTELFAPLAMLGGGLVVLEVLLSALWLRRGP